MASNPFLQELAARGDSEGREAANPFRQEMGRRRSEEPGLVEENVSSAKSFVGGVLDVIGMPADLINIPLRAAGLPTIPSGGQDLRALASEYGLAYTRGSEPDGIGNRASRILGNAAIPYAGIVERGARLAKAGSRGAGFIDDAARLATSRPGATFAAEAGSIAGATAGGEVAEKVAPDSDIAEVVGELVGGFSPTVAVLTPSALLARAGTRAVKTTLLPFTKAGGTIRASRRLQSAAADPEQAAARVGGVDTLPGLSPARSTGDKRLLAIERAVANDDPALDARLTAELSAANRATRDAAGMGGDPARVRSLLENRRDYLIGLIGRRAEIAGRQAKEAVARLDPDATPREISRVAREKVERALTDAQATESRLWGALDKGAPASLARSREVLAKELAQRSRFEDPTDIAPWIKVAMKGKAGVTFGDVHAIRKRLGVAIGRERAKPAPNRNKLRILGNLYDSLLEDMAGAKGQGEALDTALAFSRELNQRFRHGAVGRLLGYERRGGHAVSPQDTLRKVVSGEASGTQVRQLLEASPGAGDEVKRYMRAAFLAQTMEDGKFNTRAARVFLNKHDEVLERFPGLRSELTDAREMNRLAERLSKRGVAVERLAYNAKKSRAALYLDGPIGEEWNRVLRAENPAAVARALHRRVRGDKRAVQGLKSSFVEELIERSQTRAFDEAGEPIVSGSRLKNLVGSYRGVLSALNMSEGESARLARVVNTFTRIEARPAGKQVVMDDNPAAFLDLLARWMGAQTGQRIASHGTGSSLVMAQAFSQRMRGALQHLTRDKASELIAASVEDPELFRALLVGPTSSAKRQTQAVQRINAWLAAPATEQAQQDEP